MKAAREILPSLTGAKEDCSAAWHEAIITACWADAVGPSLAEHTQPGPLVKGRLTVFVDAPDWAKAVEAVAPEIRRKLERAAGRPLVRWISFYTRRPRKPPARAATSVPAADEVRDPIRRRIYHASRLAAGK